MPSYTGATLCSSQLRLECLFLNCLNVFTLGKLCQKRSESHKLRDSETNIIHKNFSLILKMLWENKEVQVIENNFTFHHYHF